MPRRKRSISPNCDITDDEFDDEVSSNGSRHPPGQRNAANARERARMRILSSAFCRLKTKLPWVPPDTKLSKLDTLRLATTYIQQLGALLAGESDRVDSSMPQNLTWPFHFQQPPDQKQSSSPSHLSTSSSNSNSDQWNSLNETNEILSFRETNTSVYNSVLHGQ